MEDAITSWLIAHGIPRQLAPDSLVLVGMAGFLGGFLVLRQAHRDGAPVSQESRALAIAFVAAWLGAALFELVWILPTLFSTNSLASRPEVDRNFYGGMLAGSVAPAVYLRWRRADIWAYFDRSALLWGAILVCTRLGCFLDGCCFGRPTATSIGLRFPPGSPAARAHVESGWIPPHAWSLPVHPTQLYEVGLGLIATSLACVVLRRRARRDGTAFLLWVAIYATGRLWLETLRADATPSPITWLSRAQLLSVIALLFIAVVVGRRLVQARPLLRARLAHQWR